jgi:very-short-patch-repair endonuclease
MTTHTRQRAASAHRTTTRRGSSRTEPHSALQGASRAPARAASEPELAFDTRWLQLGTDGVVFQPEYRFHPTRRWRFDRALPELKIAVEIEGGTWSGGRHTRGAGYEGDCTKYNAAAVAGWAVLRFTSTMLDADPAGCIEQIQALINARLTGGSR